MSAIVIGVIVIVLIVAFVSMACSQGKQTGPHDPRRNPGDDSYQFFVNDGGMSHPTPLHSSEASQQDSGSQSGQQDSGGGDSGGGGGCCGGGDGGGGGGGD